MNKSSYCLFFLIFYWFIGLYPVLAKEDVILPPYEAFTPSIEVQGDEILVSVDIKEGYYVYRDLQLKLVSNNEAISLSKPYLSEGEVKHDAFFGEQSVWFSNNTAEIKANYQAGKSIKDASFTLTLQGCKDKILCYPPEPFDLNIDIDQNIINHLPIDFINKTPIQNASPVMIDDKKSLLGFSSENKASVLDVDDAFSFEITPISSSAVEVTFFIEKGYYLYKDKLNFDIENNRLTNVIMPEGLWVDDPFFGRQAVFLDQFKVILYLEKPSESIVLKLGYQGCAEVGICYPVVNKEVEIQGQIVTTTNRIVYEGSITGVDFVDNQLLNLLKNHLWLGLLLVLLISIPLFFTPCMLPIAPILIGMLSNQKQLSTKRSAWLAFCYILGMSFMMAIFGYIFAATGINLQLLLQKPWLLIMFALFFVLMGISMLGLFSIGLPVTWQNRVYQLQSKFKANNSVNVFVIGALSSLVVGSCATPLLFALLAFVSTVGNPMLGALSLFMMGMGMGLPLIVFAIFSNHIPKTGGYSKLITKLFAMLMFGLAFWFVSRLLPPQVNMMVWGLFALVLAYLLMTSKLTKLINYSLRFIAILFMLIGFSWLAGGLLGGDNILKPFTKTIKPTFEYVTSLSEIKQIVDENDKPVLLDFYADWCVSCKEFELFTLSDPVVVKTLEDFRLIKLDLTNTNKEHRLILKHFNLLGPPVLLFFNQGRELENLRLVGNIDKDVLLKQLEKAK